MTSNLNSLQQRVAFNKSKGAMIGALLMIITVTYLNRTHSMHIAANLPFTPFSLIQKLTHYGLDGDNYRQCSITLIFVLSNQTLGTYVKKLLQVEGPRVATPTKNPFFN